MADKFDRKGAGKDKKIPPRKKEEAKNARAARVVKKVVKDEKPYPDKPKDGDKK